MDAMFDSIRFWIFMGTNIAVPVVVLKGIATALTWYYLYLIRKTYKEGNYYLSLTMMALMLYTLVLYGKDLF